MDNTLVFNIDINYLKKTEMKLIELINKWLDANNCNTFVSSNTFGVDLGEIIIVYDEIHKKHKIRKLVKEILDKLNVKIIT